MKQKYDEFAMKAEKEIRDLQKKIDGVLSEWQREAQKLYNEQGEEGFKGDFSDYYGVANINIDIGHMDENLYLFLNGMDTGHGNTGWVPSNYID